MTAGGHRVSLRDDEVVLKLIVVMVAQLCAFAKNHQIIPFKCVLSP